MSSDPIYKRCALYYVSLLSTLEIAFVQGGEKARQALSQFDAEWPQIQTGHGHAARRSSSTDPDWLQIQTNFAMNGRQLLMLRQTPQERMPWLECGLEAARRMKRRDLEGRVLCNIAVDLMKMDNYAQAIVVAQQALHIADEYHLPQIREACLSVLGAANLEQGRHKEAEGYQKEALTLTRDMGDTLAESQRLGNLGNIAEDRGDYAEAESYYLQALAISEAKGDRSGLAYDHGSLGSLYRRWHQPQKALTHLEKSLKIAEQDRMAEAEAHACTQIGNAYSDQRDYKGAVPYYERALKLARAAQDRRLEAETCFNFGVACHEMGQSKTGIEHMTWARTLFQEIDLPQMIRETDQALQVMQRPRLNFNPFRR